MCKLKRNNLLWKQGNMAVSSKLEQLPFLLDAFGNAATEGNANSSRHVRFLDFTFTGNVMLAEMFRITRALVACILSNKSQKYNT